MKRFLSIILAAVMVIALLPSAFAATDAETGKTVYKYEFTLAGAIETATETNTALNGAKRKLVEAGMGNDSTEAGDDWSYIGHRNLSVSGDARYQPQLTEDGFWMHTGKTNVGAFAGTGLVLKITVGEKGTYIPTLKYLPHHDLTGDLYAFIIDPSLKQVGNKTCNFETDSSNTVSYVLANEAWKNLTEVQLAVSGAMEKMAGVPTSTDIKKLSGNSVTLEAGEYYLLIAGSLSSRYAPYINSFELEKVPTLKLEASATTVEMEKTVTITPTFDGTTADKIKYTSAPANVVNIVKNADGSATVTGVSRGTATITATIEGTEISDSVDIKVTGEITKYEFTLGAVGEEGTETNSIINAKYVLAEKGMRAGDWTYLGGRGLYTATSEFSSQFSEYGFWWYSADTSGALGSDGIVFEITVPEDGEYATTLNYIPCKADGTVYACIIDKAIDGRANGINKFPYDFCEMVEDVGIISSVSYALTALKASLTGEKDLRSEIKLALSGILETADENTVTTDSMVSISGTDTVALKAGKYYFLVAKDGSNKYMPYINSFEIEKVGELDTELDAAFDVNKKDNYEYTAPTVDGLTEDGAIDPVDNGDGTYTLIAPEFNDDGEAFLYWARGLTTQKRIVSFDRIINNYVPTENGRNFLIAVYDTDGPDVENAEWYNANGQLIATGTKPTDLSMAGYGSVTGWKQYGDKNIHVAEYGNKTQPDNVTVTVNGENKTVPYGTSVTCTADATDGSGNPFKCWTKTNINGDEEIVSVDKTYTFRAWENCKVTANYGEHSFVSVVMKIITDSFDAGSETGIMAEFIGFDNKVVEKGVMWNDTKIAMTKPGNQFSVIADKNGEYKGYAILKNTDGTYSLITGNVITVPGAAE